MSTLSPRKLAIAGAILLASASLGLAISRRPQAASAAPSRYVRPNIVLVMMDDLALSQARPQVMPKVTKLLRDRGTSFRNAFLTTPLCCPSRATLLTGQYGHNNGVLRNTYHSLRRTRNVLPVWLREAGYVTAHVGKFLNRYHPEVNQSVPAPGWDQWHTQLDSSKSAYYNWDLSRNGRRIHYGERDSDYAPRVFERSALRVVRRFVPRRKPLYLELDEIAPHNGRGRPGSGCRLAPVPDPLDVGKFQYAQLPKPPSFNEEDVSDKPSFLRTKALMTQDEIDELTRRYRCGLAALQQVDRTVGHLHQEFKRLGELGRTVFIFYTDNGLFFGEHRIRGGKIYPYEEADRTPLFIRLPARYRNGHPRVAEVSEPVANIDLAPTILRLAHGRPCGRSGRCRVMDGRSLLPLLRGRKPSWAASRPLGVEIQLGNGSGQNPVCEYAGIRLPGAIFVRHTQVANPEGVGCVNEVRQERYNLTADPYQLHNLCFGGGGCPADGLQTHLRRLLARVQDCSGVPGRDPRPSNGNFCG